MTAEDLDDTLAAIARQAKALRESGVYGRVTIGDITFNVEPPVATIVQLPAGQQDDPLNDAATYGTDEVPKRRKPFSNDAARAEFERE